MRTIVWWAVWGLAVSIAVIGFLEARNNHLILALAIPLLTATVAAAFVRLEYDYHHLVAQARWMAMSAVFLMGAAGYVYLKSQALGPFATGTTHKAFMGATFGMSVHEVERALNRPLLKTHQDRSLGERAEQWVLDALPVPKPESDSRFSLPLVVFRVASQASFHFAKGQLNRVNLEFEPVSHEDSQRLLERLHEELAREYRRTDHTSSLPGMTWLYHKDAVEAKIMMEPLERRRRKISVDLNFLPLRPAEPAPPVAVEANAF